MFRHRFSRAAILTGMLVFTVTAAHADSPYEAFRYPDVHTQEFFTSGHFQMDSNRAAQPSGAQRGYDAQTQFTLRGSRLDQTDRHTRQLSLSTRPVWDKNLSRNTSQLGGTNFSSARDVDASFLRSDLGWFEDWFTAGSRWGVGSALFISHFYARLGVEDKISGLTPPDEDIATRSELQHSYQAIGSWSIDAGRGRVRDVTGVMRAAALEDRLERYGRLAHPLSEAARLKLAQWFSAEDGLFAPHDQPAKVLWREVARILREDGALKAGELDAEALERVQEDIAPRSAFSLRRGTRVAAVLELSRFGGHSDLRRHDENLSLTGGVVTAATSFDASNTRRQDTRRSRVGLAVHTSHPQGLLSQWAVDWRVLTGDGPARSLEMTTRLSYQRLLLDRLYGSATAQHQTFVAKDGDDYGQPMWQLALVGILSYRVEDHWSVDLEVAHSDLTERATRISIPFPGYVQTFNSNHVQLGLTWRPSGRFDSPTLGMTERPMAMAR